MNYAAMARAIRAERRGIWEELGKPVVINYGWKPRQMSMTPPPISLTQHVPWRDLKAEDMMWEAMLRFWFGEGPTRKDETQMRGIIAQRLNRQGK